MTRRAATRMADPSTRHAVLLARASAALFGAATPLSRWRLASLSAFQLAGRLCLGAALAASTRMLLRGAEGWRNHVRLTAAVVRWLNLELVATAALSANVFRDHLHRHAWWGVARATVAALVLPVAGWTAAWRACLFVFAACICWGLDNHVTAPIDGLTPSQSALAVPGLGEPLTWTLLLAGVLFGAGVVTLLREAYGHVQAHVHAHTAAVHSQAHRPDPHHRHWHARYRGGDE